MRQRSELGQIVAAQAGHFGEQKKSQGVANGLGEEQASVYKVMDASHGEP
jgi:hypothetical protein